MWVVYKKFLARKGTRGRNERERRGERGREKVEKKIHFQIAKFFTSKNSFGFSRSIDYTNPGSVTSVQPA